MAAAHLPLVFLATSWTRVQSGAPYQENSFNGGIVMIPAFKEALPRRCLVVLRAALANEIIRPEVQLEQPPFRTIAHPAENDRSRFRGRKPGGDEWYWLIDIGFAPADYAAGKTHKRLRNELNPAFTPATIRNFTPIFERVAQEVSIAPIMTRRHPLPQTFKAARQANHIAKWVGPHVVREMQDLA
ncbi:hypothetical protein B0H14DRAFT_2565324 [Mycena olivaceomarginata]|nr:hypothetical protein B0H14DRAFT_2565324 [Mycena olivaceomarginata]